MNKQSPETIEKIRSKAIGRKHSEETKQKLRNIRKLQVIPKWTEEMKKKYRGKNASRWKGDEVGYRSLHRWVESESGKPRFCEHCKRTDLPQRNYHWANKSGKYRRILIDWLRLCALCHKRYDKRMKHKKIHKPITR